MSRPRIARRAGDAASGPAPWPAARLTRHPFPLSEIYARNVQKAGERVTRLKETIADVRANPGEAVVGGGVERAVRCTDFSARMSARAETYRVLQPSTPPLCTSPCFGFCMPDLRCSLRTARRRWVSTNGIRKAGDRLVEGSGSNLTIILGPAGAIPHRQVLPPSSSRALTSTRRHRELHGL